MWQSYCKSFVTLGEKNKTTLKLETDNVDFYCETRTKLLKPTDCSLFFNSLKSSNVFLCFHHHYFESQLHFLIISFMFNRFIFKMLAEMPDWVWYFMPHWLPQMLQSFLISRASTSAPLSKLLIWHKLSFCILPWCTMLRINWAQLVPPNSLFHNKQGHCCERVCLNPNQSSPNPIHGDFT